MTAPSPVPVSSPLSADPSRIPPDDVWRATEQLLRDSDSAAVMAIGANGLFQPMSASVPLFGHPVIEGHASALELVAPHEMAAVIDTWKQSLINGAGRVEVELLSSGSRITLHFMDVRDRYQVILGVVVHHDRRAGLSGQRVPDDELRPRFSSVRKNELSQFIEIDEAFQLMLGHDRIELVGRRSLELIHPDDHAVAIANWMDLLAAPGRSRRVRLRQRHADGRWIWFEVTNHNRLNDPEASAIVADMVDISDEVAAHQTVRAHELLLARLTESLPVGVLQIDPQALVVHRNDRVSELLDAPVGAQLSDIFVGLADPDAALLHGLIENAITRGDDAEVELPVRRGDGTTVRCRMAVKALAEAGALICLDDVTERSGRPALRPAS